MRKVLSILVAVAIAACGLPTVAYAQAVSLGNVVNPCSTPNGTTYTVNTNRPFTVDQNGNICTNNAGGTAPQPYQFTPVSGSQYQLTLASVTTLTVPATAKYALVRIENNATYSAAANCTDDGATTPTSTKGTYLAPGASWLLSGASLASNLSCIQAASSAALDVDYYK